ncbi:MAG: chorismate-binding protein [Sphingomonas sp.]
MLAPVLPPGRYGAMVAAAKAYIEAGDIFQVVLAQRFTAPFALPPFELYRALRRVNPLAFPLPSRLARLRADRLEPRDPRRARATARSRSARSRAHGPRGRTASEDEANRASLLADPKECAEHLMLLDLGRNDVGPRRRSGKRARHRQLYGRILQHVMHIVSNVVGALRPGQDALDALFAGFPAGTVSGAPKVRACEIIAELEPETRGPYAGGVGYFSPDGSMDSCIVLRTALVKDGTIHVQAGAGIVADSDPAYEQRECEAKAGALLAAAREGDRAGGGCRVRAVKPIPPRSGEDRLRILRALGFLFQPLLRPLLDELAGAAGLAAAADRRAAVGQPRAIDVLDHLHPPRPSSCCRDRSWSGRGSAWGCDRAKSPMFAQTTISSGSVVGGQSWLP